MPKTNLVDFGRHLVSLDYELVASGGTATTLASADLPVTKVEDLTGYPSILAGRVKTLHPKIHGGILTALSSESDLTTYDLPLFDRVVCNLYPFERSRTTLR